MLASDEAGGTLDVLRFSLASEIVELVVLTHDDAFLQTLRDAVCGARRLWHVPSADKVSDLLVAGEVGILMLDVQALNETPTVFVGRIKRQFPDLVLVVAGNREAEISLAALISAGLVYRFIHKPMSPGRAKLFADAAVKKYEEQRWRTAVTPPIRRAASSNGAALIGGAIGVLGAIVVATWVLHRTAHEAGTPRTAAMPHPGATESPQLVRAAVALAGNRLTKPADDNALELYLQAQARNPADPVARAGLAEVRERLLARAENALLEERLDEAAVAIETARRSGVESGRIAFLTAQLGKSRQQVKSAKAAARAIAKTEPRPDDKVTPLLQLAAERTDQAHRIDPEGDGTGFMSAESNAMRHDLDSAVAGQQFLEKVVGAGALSLIKSVQPAYPVKAELSKVQGWVELDFTVAEGGEVKDIAVHGASTPGVFDGAAISALSQWLYKPILHDGKPVPQRARIRMRFTLSP